MAYSKVNDTQLMEIRKKIHDEGKMPTSLEIQTRIRDTFGYEMDVSTIRGRFCEMGYPLSRPLGTSVPPPPPKEEPQVAMVNEVKQETPVFNVPEEFKAYIPKEKNFDNYIVRGIDKRLAIHYNAGKYPLTQGKQGTGKSFGHEYYAFTHKLPLFVYTCSPDFKLEKLFGDKSLVNGNIVFKEALFCKGIQTPSVHLFDEIQQVENKNMSSFHSVMQERKLFVKDADNGNGKWYHLHPECRIGFAQNPKSAKYIGGSVKPSNFLGRCTFITYPEFKPSDIKKAIEKKFTTLTPDQVRNFTTFYFACTKAIENGKIPVDISIRQLNSVIELWLAGLPLKESIEDGLTSIMDAASQPKNKDALWRLAQAVWKELMDEPAVNKLSEGFNQLLRGV